MGSCQGRPRAAFILTLDNSPRHFILELGTKRNAVQLGFVPYWIRLSVRIGTPSAMLPNCLPLSFPFVHRSTLISASYPCVSQSLACNHHSYPASIRTLKEPHWARCTLGFDLKPGPITIVTGPGWLGARHLIGDLDGSGVSPQSPEQGEWMSLLQTFPITNWPPRHQRIFCSLDSCLFAIASVNYCGILLGPAYAAVACAVLVSAPV